MLLMGKPYIAVILHLCITLVMEENNIYGFIKRKIITHGISR